jgi:hypothetical protein
VLTPWLIVFRLNGGGALMAPPAVFGGASSGENSRLSEYELRLMPYRLIRSLST